MAGARFANWPPVTFTELNRFMKEKGHEKPCPECGKLDWRVPAGGSSVDAPAFCGLIHEAEADSETEMIPFFPSFLTFCGNCGYVKLFAGPVVVDWRNKNG
jgi:hypothetical protein